MIGWFFFGSARQALDAELSKRLTSIAQVVAATINPRYVGSIRPGDEGSSLYRTLIADLARIKTVTRVKDIYIFDRDNRIILDADEETPIGQEYLLLKLDQRELEGVWSGGAAASTLYEGSDGKLYKSGYAPLNDSRGAVFAAVGVEGGAEFFEVIDRARRQMLVIALAGALLAAGASVLLARSIVAPLQSLVTAVESVGQREAYPQVEIGRRDEIGYLGERFNAMVSGLAEKDRQLNELYRREKERANLLEDEIRIKERLAALGEMSAGIAHEIRNPLGAIAGFTELLDRRVTDPAARELTREILLEVQNLNRIVTQFLTFVREPQLRLEPADLPAVVKAAIDAVMADKGRAGIRLETQMADGLPAVPVDADLLKQAVMNLIQNGIDAMPSGGTLGIRLEAREPWLLIAVSDSGEGISPADRRRIFDPFFTTKKEGTGLGLAITHRLIQAHGGKIEVESQPGRGSCFTVWLPMRRAAG
ncbi:MAG: HAMP domain-containing protein [Nitrospirae bacterium]|nr:HAMP domain-containing protein [Nitrospirota bacterium]